MESTKQAIQPAASRARRPASAPLPRASCISHDSDSAPLRRKVIQAKLTLSHPDDRFEKEADRIADQVLRMPDPALTRPGIDPTPIRPLSIQRLCKECEDELQRQFQDTGTDPGSSSLDTIATTLRHTGSLLDSPTRAFFEPRFGVDFSAVRIHTDTQASESARAVNALAYTVGHDVVFNSGQYAPHSDTGRRLLAHELTHVVQQGGGIARQPADAGTGTDAGEPMFETKSGQVSETDVQTLAAVIFAESSRTDPREDAAVGYVLVGKMKGGASIQKIVHRPRLYSSVTGHKGKGSREYRAFIGDFEPGDPTGLPQQQPKTMQAYADQLAPAITRYRALALRILNLEEPNPVMGAVGQGGMIDLFSDYPARDENGNYRGHAKNTYWEGVKARHRYLQIGRSVFVWEKAEDVPGQSAEKRAMTPGTPKTPKNPASPEASPLQVAPKRETLFRQVVDAGTAASPPAARADDADARRKEVLRWAERLSGLPYAYSGDDTVAQIAQKQRQLADEIAGLKANLHAAKSAKPTSGDAGAPGADAVQKTLKALEQAEKTLAELAGQLAAARESCWQKTLRALIVDKTGPASNELLTALRDYGVVCNTYTEAVMRLSGYHDFPLTGQIYLPQSERYEAIDKERMQKRRGLPGWGLEWAERMVDWALANGSVIYDSASPPAEMPAPAAGDIVLFLRPGGNAYHANIVAAEAGGSFNLIGASRPGHLSGRALTTPFKSYADRLPGRGGPQSIPQIMGQDRYAWILRPGRALPAPADEAAPGASVKPDEAVLHRHAPAGAGGGAVSAWVERSIRGLSGHGDALPAGLRDFAEAGLGQALPDVRIHTGPRADALAREVKADAFTLGRDVFFGEGHFAPQTWRGRRLIAHELAHVMQQAAAPTTTLHRFTAELGDSNAILIRPEMKDTDADLDRVLCPGIQPRRIAGRSRIDVTACFPPGVVKAMSVGPLNCNDFVRRARGEVAPGTQPQVGDLLPRVLWEELLKKGYRIRSIGAVRLSGRVETLTETRWKPFEPRMGDLVFMNGSIHLKGNAKSPDRAGDNFTVDWDHVAFFILRSRDGVEYHLAKDGDENPVGIYHTGMMPEDPEAPEAEGAYVKGATTLTAYLAAFDPDPAPPPRSAADAGTKPPRNELKPKSNR
ncbi:MAG: DUF4157 domain-containing protein [Candidatus Accumulibacter sp. UW20]|jgi:hypothetical protein